jgi:hypothetical protein
MNRPNDKMDGPGGGKESLMERAPLVVGRSYRLFFHKDNRNNCRFEVRAIVDEDQVVTRMWSKTKRQWVYRVDNWYLFDLYHKEGILTTARRRS